MNVTASWMDGCSIDCFNVFEVHGRRVEGALGEVELGPGTKTPQRFEQAHGPSRGNDMDLTQSVFLKYTLLRFNSHTSLLSLLVW